MQLTVYNHGIKRSIHLNEISGIRLNNKDNTCLVWVDDMWYQTDYQYLTIADKMMELKILSNKPRTEPKTLQEMIDYLVDKTYIGKFNIELSTIDIYKNRQTVQFQEGTELIKRFRESTKGTSTELLSIIVHRLIEELYVHHIENLKNDYSAESTEIRRELESSQSTQN